MRPERAVEGPVIPTPDAVVSPIPPLNVLILNGDFPVFPGGIGVEFLNTTNLASFARTVGLVSMVHTQAVWERTQQVAEQGVRLFLWKNPAIDHAHTLRSGVVHTLHRKLAETFYRFRALTVRPADTVMADLSFRNMAKPLLDALSERAWHVFVVVQSSAAAAIDYIPEQAVKVLVMHDIRSVVYARRAEIATSWAERRHLRAQARRYFEFEKKYASRYDLLIAVSEVDADWIRRHYSPKQVIALPLPMDTEYFAPEHNSTEKPGRIVFTGLMNHPPNTDAAIFFATEVFPKIRAVIPGSEFCVVGKDPPSEVLALRKLPGVLVTGTVPDTRPYLSSAALVVVPLRFGSGVRHKILEAWAMRKCVVSTSIGAEGLTYTEGEHLAIADGPDALAETALRGLRDSGFHDRLRQGGREIVETLHDPKRIARSYYEQIERSVAACREQPMRVALDMHWMVPGLAGGVENLARALLDQLIQMDAYNRYTVILPNCCSYDFDLRGHANFKIVSPDSTKLLMGDLSWALRHRLHSLLRLDYWQSPEVRNLRYLRALDADIVYSFPGYIHPDVYPLRHVLQIPDIQHEYYPEFFSKNELMERRRLFGESIQRADHIVAISEFTRKTLIERMGIPPEKVTTVLLAAEPIFRPVGNLEPDNHVMRKYGLESGRYLFFPAHTWPHKNHCAAIAALALLRDRYNTRMPLVFTGGDRGARGSIDQQIKAAGLDGQILFLGYCPRRDLPALFRGAASLVYPSLFEGFGMPVLEAMASGCPVVCSNTTSLPEIAGDAASMVDPNDHDRLAEAIYRINRDRELRASLIQRGFAQSSLFSWRRNALETISVLYRANQRAKGASCE